jgi:hypothetical protein
MTAPDRRATDEADELLCSTWITPNLQIEDPQLGSKMAAK